MVVFARHDLHPGGRAERLGVGVGETNASCRQLVDVWGPVGGSSITTESLNANIISQDEQDVWFGNPCLGKGGAEDGWKQSQQTHIHTRVFRLLSC